MALKQVILSDISGAELTDETHVTVLVTHPDDRSRQLRLDLTTEEADKLTESTLRFYEFSVMAPNVPPRKVMMETKVVDKLFPDFEKVLEGAPRAEVSAPAPTRPAKKSAATPSGRTDFTAPENYGKLHRGRITEREAELVRANPDQASKNRGTPIDWNDPKEKSRYGL